MAGERLIPIRLELDLSNESLTPQMSRYIKNLTFYKSDTSQVSNNQSGSAGEYRPLESTTVFDSGFVFPNGYNHFIGAYPNVEENWVLFHYYNDNEFHFIGRIAADSQTVDMVYMDACLNYQLNPENFIHEGGAYLEVFKYNDPVTGLPKKRSYYNFTDGYNDFRFLCIEDAIATSGFSSRIFPYFVNPHDKCLMINAGVPKPKGCVSITEVPNDNPSAQNPLRFHTWQFMVQDVDVYGRPSEWGDIGEIYIPGENDCIGTSELLPRCLDLEFDAGNPLVNQKNIAFRNCNDLQWSMDTTLFLYRGTNLGDWWLRERNPDVNFNSETNKIKYRFCKDKECNPIPQDETNRTQNPLPRVTQSVSKIGKFIAPSNNKHGFFPFGNEIMDNISIKVEKPTVEESGLANIEIFVPIFNYFKGTQQPIHIIDGKGAFGGVTQFQLNNDTIIPFGVVPGLVSAYRQNFTNLEQRGFIGYLAGTGTTPISTISEQYYVDGTEFVKVENYDSFSYKRKYYQKFTFNSVSRGKYVFRIADHQAELTQNFQITSTYTAGVFTWNPESKITSTINKISDTKELRIDACNGDYSSLNENTILMIYDITNPPMIGPLWSDQSRAAKGYVYEQITEGENNIPVELLKVSLYNAGDGYELTSIMTDHNGFYFATDNQKEQIYNIYGYCGCNNYIRFSDPRTGNDPGVIDLNISLDSPRCVGYSQNICNRVLIKGKVLLCGTDIPVPGVGVVYTRGGTAITGADGEFSIIAHDYAVSPGQARTDTLFFSSTICPYTDCDGNCLPQYDITFSSCTVCSERVITVDTFSVNTISKRGLLSGGNYGVSIWGEDWLGRHGFAQTKNSLYFTTPSLVETQTFSPSKVTLTIPPTTIFPSWMTELHIGITKELSMGGEYISWIPDKIEFIDNSGKINDAAPTQIKIYYASLNEYNIQNNFNTTTHWQFIVQDEGGVQSNYTSDYVEFYMNGDGNFFPTLTRALIKYDQTGQYFLIDYDASLKDLKQYALIRLGRPQVCATKDVFYDFGCSIKVINGQAQQSVIVLDAFDTYYKYRQIPIPVTVAENETENVVRTFGFPFEHHSPSDLWGDHCINIGKVNARNPYEAEIIRENQFMLSGAMSVNGQLNYLNYFDEALAIDFDSWDFGGVTSAIPFVSGVYVICEFNCFVVGFNDNILRINANGQVQVPSADSRFGNPEVKIGGNYGCSLFDKNTIRKKDGYVQFLDTREGGLVQSNYSDDVIVSRVDETKGVVGGVDSWLRAKIKYVQQWNQTHSNKKYFHGTINPAARVYLLSDFTIRSTDYVNEERGVSIESHETLSFDYRNRFFRQFLSETPQGFSYMEGQSKDLQFFLFADKIYTHYSMTANKTYNIIFGTSVERVLRICSVLDGMQKKQFNNLTVFGKYLYFADQVFTDSNQRSRILKAAFRQGDSYWSAPILCNLDTPADSNIPERFARNILDGQKMYGSFIDIRLIGNPQDNNIYTEITGFIIEVQAEGKVLS